MNPAIPSDDVRCARCDAVIKPGDKAMFKPLPDKGLARVHILCFAKARIRRFGKEPPHQEFTGKGLPGNFRTAAHRARAVRSAFKMAKPNQKTKRDALQPVTDNCYLCDGTIRAHDPIARAHELDPPRLLRAGREARPVAG